LESNQHSLNFASTAELIMSENRN